MKLVTNLSTFEELAEKIKKCISFYERKQMSKIIYNLHMDNGEDISISFVDNNIAHLLGIDTEYLKSTGYFKGSSYNILKEVIDNPYRVSKMVRDGHLNYKSFISDYAFDKTENFQLLCSFDLSKLEFICSYSKDRFITANSRKNTENAVYSTDIIPLEGDYYIAFNTKDKLVILGLKKNGRRYYPMTNRIINFDNNEEMDFLYNLLANQNITAPTYINKYDSRRYYNIGKKFYIYTKEKIEKLRRLSFYREEYGCSVDVASGYLFTCQRLNNNYRNNEELPSISKDISSFMERRLPIDISYFESKYQSVSKDIISIIESYNASLTKSIEEAKDEHTKKIEEERDALHSLNEKHLKELEELRREVLAYKKKNEDLSIENQGLKEVHAKVRELLQG